MTDPVHAAPPRSSSDCDSWGAAELHHDRAWVFRTESGRVGRILAGDDFSGLRTSAFARLDPTADDPSPTDVCERMTSDDHGAPLSALATLCWRQQDDVVLLVAVPVGAGATAPDADVVTHVLRREAEARAQVATALRGEAVTGPRLCDEVELAHSVMRELADLRKLTEEQDRINTRLRERVAELEAARARGVRSRIHRQRAAGLTRR